MANPTEKWTVTYLSHYRYPANSHLLSLETLDVDESLLHCDHQPGGDETWYSDSSAGLENRVTQDVGGGLLVGSQLAQGSHPQASPQTIVR